MAARILAETPTEDPDLSGTAARLSRGSGVPVVG